MQKGRLDITPKGKLLQNYLAYKVNPWGQASVALTSLSLSLCLEDTASTASAVTTVYNSISPTASP